MNRVACCAGAGEAPPYPDAICALDLSAHTAQGRFSAALLLPWIDNAQILNNLELTIPRLRDIHPVAQVMLARYHFRRTARCLFDVGVIERPDDGLLVERAGLLDRRLPELQGLVMTRATAPCCKQCATGKSAVVILQQLLTEGIVDVLIIIQAAVQALDVLCWHQVQEVFVEVRANNLTTSCKKASVVQLFEKRC